jgi:hypothetical protein
LLKATAGGRRKNRMKSALEGGNSSRKKSGTERGSTEGSSIEEGPGTKKHKCPICHQLGHHWYTCTNGNPDDIAAYEAER